MAKTTYSEKPLPWEMQKKVEGRGLLDILSELAKGGMIPEIKPWRPTTMSPEKEEQFQKDIQGLDWFKEFVQKYGEPPNLDTPNYNYRGAWREGIVPTQRNSVDQMYHWPTLAPSGAMLKSPYHPSAWMESFMQQYPGANPENEEDPRVMQYRTAWQQKYPPRR